MRQQLDLLAKLLVLQYPANEQNCIVEDGHRKTLSVTHKAFLPLIGRRDVAVDQSRDVVSCAVPGTDVDLVLELHGLEVLAGVGEGGALLPLQGGSGAQQRYL